VGSSTAWGVRWAGREQDDNTLFNILSVGFDYVETMRMELAAGRDFSRDFGSDSVNVLINQAAARAMGFDQPVLGN
jgi:putative ABC transport system permease protein